MKRFMTVLIVFLLTVLLNYSQSQETYPKGILHNGNNVIAITKEQYLDCSKAISDIEGYRKGSRDCNTAKNICEKKVKEQDAKIVNLNEQVRIMTTDEIVYKEQTENSTRQLRNERIQKWISITIATAVAIVAILK